MSVQKELNLLKDQLQNLCKKYDKLHSDYSLLSSQQKRLEDRISNLENYHSEFEPMERIEKVNSWKIELKNN